MDPAFARELQTLVSVLGLALSNNEDRKIAEEHLNQIQHYEGHCVRLLHVIGANDLEITIRQVASIHFKNVIAKHWAPQSQGIPKISDTDRPNIREQLVQAIIYVPPIIRVQLGECLKSIIQTDYPVQWPGLLQSIEQSLNSRDQQRISGALFVLRILARKYEFKDQDDRLPVYPICDKTLPVILEIFKILLSISNPAVEIADLIKLICKIFWSLTYLEIPAPLQDPAVFESWMVCFLNLIERPIPLEGQPEDLDARKSWGWWKVKKWTLHIVNRLYHRFGETQTNNSMPIKPFQVAFQKQWAIRFLESYLVLLGTLRQGGYLTDRVINLAIQYLISSVGKGYTYAVLKNQLDVVLFEIVFPLLCFNSLDEQLWAEDPHEYVRKGYDIIEDMYSPRTAAQNFIAELFRKRWKENLAKFVQFIVEIFARYNAAPPHQKPYRQKDGALLAVGSLSDRLKVIDPYKAQLETMLVQHVYPEFSSPAGHLRAKAAWVAGQYAGIQFSDHRNFIIGLRSVVAALKDGELPVRVDSVIALKFFVEACPDLEEIRAILPQLLDEFFKLMNEVENEDLVVTLEAIVDKFGEEMAPYALGLCQNLAAAFWKCLQSSESDEDEDDSGALAAVGCLRAIGTILESVSGLPHLFPVMEPILLPIMQKMLTTDGQDVFEEVLEIVSYMTYYSPSISLEMWTLWPLIMDALDDWAVDYYENILVPLDNYISRSTEHFLTCKSPNYQQRLFDSLSAILADEKLEDPDVIAAPKLIESVFQNCRGRVDEWVEPYLRVSIDRLRKANRNGLKDLLIEVVANALYYNPVLTLNILQKLGVTNDIFHTWYQMLYATKKNGTMAHFKREHDKKVCILGLTSVLTVPSEMQTWIFQAVLKLLIGYKEQVAEAKKASEEQRDFGGDMEGFDSEDDDIDRDGDEDEDEVNNEKFRNLVSRAFRRDEFEDDDSDDEFIEDEEFQAAIDNVDPFIYFEDFMKGLSAADPARFQTLRSSLDFRGQATANAVAQHAEARRLEIQNELNSVNAA